MYVTVGNTVKINMVIRDYEGDPHSPDEVALRLYDGRRDKVYEAGPLTPTGTGKYEHDFVVPEGPGPLTIEVEGTFQSHPDLPQIQRMRMPRRWA